jgi:hypothetical protein
MAVEGCGEWQRLLLQLLQRRDQDLRAERSTRPEAIVLEALVAAIHDGQSEVRVGQICHDANAILRFRGERLQLESRKVGSILHELGLTTERLDRLRRGLRLSRELQEHVHQLARTYCVRAMARPFADCGFCTGSAAAA